LSRSSKLLIVAAVVAAGCGEPSGEPPAEAPRASSTASSREPSAVQDALAAGEALVLSADEALTTAAGTRCEAQIRALDGSAPGAVDAVTIDYPLEGSFFPPGFVPPEFLWHDDSPVADAWLLRVDFVAGEPILAVVAGPPPEQGWIDRRAIDDTNEIYQPTEYQASAHAWTPSTELWAALQERSRETVAMVTVLGFDAGDPERVVSRGQVRVTTSRDEVGAPIFYRDVPLMPAVSEETGEIKPLGPSAVPLIEWRLRDTTKRESKLVLTGMSKCANCHSFSLDGKTMGMDVDGPHGDKGAYAMVPVEPQMVIDDERVITWNSFEDKEPDQKTIGFLSRISPDGTYAVTTLNEAIYTASFIDFRFLQVFFPTRGILGWTSIETGKIQALPGADDPRYVHVNPVWLPDGKSIVFARAEAFDPPRNRKEMARYPNDEREPQIRYDLYRMDFDEGRGGTPVPIEGASNNGMSNTFPKVSPDGKWLVYTQCRNGLLMRPDGRLRIVPVDGGESREMRCNTRLMNSWHSFSPNGRWMVFSSKSRTPYTQMFLTHIDENGDDTPAILIPDSTAANRAVNLPEFLNAPPEALDNISVPAVEHEATLAYYMSGLRLMQSEQFGHAVRLLQEAVDLQPGYLEARVNLAYCLLRSGDRTRATQEFLRAVETQPANSRANGWIDALLGGGTAASPADVVALRRAQAADPTNHGAARALALALVRTDAAEETMTLLTQILRVDPDDVDVRRALAYLLLRLGNAPAAVPHFERVVLTATGDVRSFVVLAWLQSASDDAIRNTERAIGHAKRACSLTESQEPRALDALAGALAAAGRYEEAVDNATRAVRLAEKNEPSLAEWIDLRRELYGTGHHLGE